MIKIGIIGMGNVAWNVHLPVLLSREDVEISWVCDKNFNKEKILAKKKIKVFSDLKKAIDFKKCDIALITTPYSERSKIFDQIKNEVKGIYFEKPFALTNEEHQYFSNSFEKYAITIGYQRRHMGVVKTVKNIIDKNLLGPVVSVEINFGDVHYSFGGFRSDKKKSGGGIFFETGSHWIDAVLFTTSAKDVKNFKSEKKIEGNLDIECDGKFDIINHSDHQFECQFYMTILKNTSNSIKYNFENCSINLSLFDDNSNLKINSNDDTDYSDFIIKDNEFLNFPNQSLDVAWSYWDKYLKSFINKRNSEISIDNFILTTKIIELFYEK